MRTAETAVAHKAFPGNRNLQDVVPRARMGTVSTTLPDTTLADATTVHFVPTSFSRYAVVLVPALIGETTLLNLSTVPFGKLPRATARVTRGDTPRVPVVVDASAPDPPRNFARTHVVCTGL